VPGVVSKYNWAWPAVGTVLKEEGFGALYKGFLPKVLRLGPGGTFLVLASLAFCVCFVLTTPRRWYPPGRLPGHNGLFPQDERQQGIDVDEGVPLIFCFLCLFLFVLDYLCLGSWTRHAAHKTKAHRLLGGLAFCFSYIYIYLAIRHSFG
jgi:hypothetical protein